MFTPEEIFNTWHNWTRDNYQQGRYLFQNRMEILEDLLVRLKESGADLDSVRVYKNRVLNTLVTKEGSKGQGKYRGWKETVSKDFDSMLVDVFDDKVKKEPKKALTEKTIYDIVKEPINNQPLIDLWGKSKFGDMWDTNMSNQAHIVGSPLFNVFFIEVMGKDWVKDKKNAPDWAKEVLDGNS